MSQLRTVGVVLAFVLLLSTLASASPAVVAMANALAPAVVAVGAVVCAVKLVWHFTGRDRW